jgi:hypothetical protein
MTLLAPLEIITRAAEGITTFFSQINWTQPSWDLLIIFLFIVSAFFYGFSLGRNRIIVILISIYMALAVANNFPYLKEITSQTPLAKLFAFQVLFFLIIFIISLFLLSRAGLPQGIRGRGRWWEIIIFSILHVGLLISVILSFLPSEALKELIPFTQLIFVSDLARFLWIALPIVAMVLIKEEE